MSNYNTLTLEEQNGIAKITLNRPDAANALNVELARELMQAAITVSESDSVRAVILTGNGKLFCAGGDIQAFDQAGNNVGGLVKEITAYLHAAISRLTRMNAPLIVAVNGAAAGAGFSLALIGDMVLAAESAKFTMAYTGIGASPDGSSSYFLPRLIGLRRTQELMLTNRRVTAAEAEDWGMVTRVVADSELMEEAEKLAAQLAAGPRLSHGVIKRLLASTFNESLETQMEVESQGIAAMMNTADGREGINAFKAKRKPEFKL
ncbi:enoyl-CoA hydratase/isomerase family protein [Litorivivens sp.]|uniref:enoyl-CoA hydratase/isomerase family protein n=1 Tax=Litorivivens sp. TaxID=2020868 RepID=UPI003562883B